MKYNLLPKLLEGYPIKTNDGRYVGRVLWVSDLTRSVCIKWDKYPGSFQYELGSFEEFIYSAQIGRIIPDTGGVK